MLCWVYHLNNLGGIYNFVTKILSTVTPAYELNKYKLLLLFLLLLSEKTVVERELVVLEIECESVNNIEKLLLLNIVSYRKLYRR